jgi:AcrR family transcriptional regulator
VPDSDRGAAVDGRRTRWDSHRVERRAQVVEAALEVLGEVGPEFGVEEVAERAGITKPVIYRHFTDRAGLVAAMGEWATASLLDDWALPVIHTADRATAPHPRGDRRLPGLPRGEPETSTGCSSATRPPTATTSPRPTRI